MDFLNTLTNMFSNSDTKKVLSENTGISAESVGKVINAALPKLVQAMTNNASSDSGARSLFEALGQHSTEKSVTEQLQNADTDDGDKIIGHILGSSADSEINSIAKETDMSSGQISQLLSNVAPSILSGLSSAVSGMQSNSEGGSGLLGILSALKS